MTGATGYVGTRLVARLLADGHSVRVLVREADRLRHKPWFRQVEICEGDAGETSRLKDALSGVHSAYYLIHSMTAGRQFSHRDVELAGSFGGAARGAGLQRIIYLGGLGEPGEALSEHLRSRQETGQALRSSGVPLVELRAAVIVGAGSISFEMIRYLTERIPLMICPRWVFRRTQPIAIDDVLSYLVAALDLPVAESRIVEIGGADILTYGQMIKTYARLRGLGRVLLPVPVLTPKLSSHWVHWTTPVPALYARPLIEGLRSEVVVRNDDARRLFPQICPVGYDAAVGRALDELQPEGFDEAVDMIVEQ
ncbi:MAG: NAD(P)H-binding protein, partial [Sedimentisphaerales bacterium]|nr:NAD(P)H-binding protein [Sedimentisphaerales bacterium]